MTILNYFPKYKWFAIWTLKPGGLTCKLKQIRFGLKCQNYAERGPRQRLTLTGHASGRDIRGRGLPYQRWYAVQLAEKGPSPNPAPKIREFCFPGLFNPGEGPSSTLFRFPNTFVPDRELLRILPGWAPTLLPLPCLKKNRTYYIQYIIYYI